MNLSDLLTEALTRDYNIYEVSFIKNRRERPTTFRSFGKAMTLYRKYKKKYKSAKWKIFEPPKILMKRNILQNNAVLDAFKKYGK